MKHTPFAIGLDLGTGSCKTALVTLDGKIIAQASAGYPSTNVHNRWKEQDPESLVAGAINSVTQALKLGSISPKDCVGISIGGAFHSLLALDSKNVPLTGVMTWADNRAKGQAELLRQQGLASRFYQATGCPPHSLYPFFKIQWLRETNPGLFNRMAWFLSAKEYLLYRFTGQRIVDYSIAGATGLLNVKKLVWDPEILGLASITSERLSTLASPASKIGSLTLEASAQMGLTPGTPVYLGSSDALNSSIGAGASTASQATCMIGTSGAIRIISPQPILDPQERVWCYAIDENHWLVGGSINNGGILLEWLQNALSDPDKMGNSDASIRDIIDWAASIPAGSEGLVCLPFMAGERSPRWNLKAKGVFYGLELHHNKRHLCRALLEGIGFRLRSVQDAIDEVIPLPYELRASGGYVQSSFWLQLTTDILNRPLMIPTYKDTSALASAYWVLLGNGTIKSLEETGLFNPVEEVRYPKVDDASAYEQKYDQYKALYQALESIFDR